MGEGEPSSEGFTVFIEFFFFVDFVGKNNVFEVKEIFRLGMFILLGFVYLGP